MLIKKDYDILIIGCGISGCTLAERYASIGKKVLIIEKRNHIGGNCYDFINKIGIRINKYGPHYFRTNDEKVWRYLQKFSEWTPFEARCLSCVDNKKVPLPVNIDTVNMLFNLNLKEEKDMQEWLSNEVEQIGNPKNSEEAALRRIGKRLYEKMFKNYTTKQWDMEPKELDPSIMDRIPIRLNHEDRYFTDTYQMYPVHGYTKMFEKMLENSNITVILNTEYDEIKEYIKSVEKTFFTGKIDSYFNESLGKLEYRSLKFEEIDLNQEYFQDTIQENYPDLNVPYTRIVEYKYQTNQKNPKTTIVKEYPTWDGEPYYPVLSEKNKRIYEKYQKETQRLEKDGVYFVGRLANYKYFNMDQAFKNALDLFERLEHEKNNQN